MTNSLTVIAPASIAEIREGDDLAAIIGDVLTCEGGPQAHDIVVLAQKIVSKAEGCSVALSSVVPGAEALALAEETGKDARLVELVLKESSAVMRARPGVMIVRHRLGLVMANAGIDQSNLTAEDAALLLPIDPDASARALRKRLMARFRVPLAVVISDSFGRAWRQGTVNVAIGAAGLRTLWDRRGERDRNGRELAVTEVAVADAVAAAAGLVMGEGAEGRPVAIVRGVDAADDNGCAGDLVRPLEQDMFP